MTGTRDVEPYGTMDSGSSGGGPSIRSEGCSGDFGGRSVFSQCKRDKSAGVLGGLSQAVAVAIRGLPTRAAGAPGTRHHQDAPGTRHHQDAPGTRHPAPPRCLWMGSPFVAPKGYPTKWDRSCGRPLVWTSRNYELYNVAAGENENTRKLKSIAGEALKKHT